MITSKRLPNGFHRLFFNGEVCGEAWKFTRQSGFGMSLDGIYWRKGQPNTRSGSTTIGAKRLKDLFELAQTVLSSGLKFQSKESIVSQQQTPSQVIQSAIAAMYREDISSDEAERLIAQLSPQQLSEFVVDAFNRGWISRFNLGIDEDGNVI